mgnify:CR=1 FL=1
MRWGYFLLLAMNKNIWIYWSQGFDNAPPLVKECLKSAKHYNPNWNIIELTDVNLKEYIDGIHHPGPLAAYSDIIRISLIEKYGGLWVDATVLFNKSLDEWLPEYITEGMFAFSKPTKRHNICSWFLYGEKDNFLIEAAIPEMKTRLLIGTGVLFLKAFSKEFKEPSRRIYAFLKEEGVNVDFRGLKL